MKYEDFKKELLRQIGMNAKYFKPKETEYSVPVSAYLSEFSILEATVVYLKDHFKISYHKIGDLLERNERTVWTVYQRAQKKRRKNGR